MSSSVEFLISLTSLDLIDCKILCFFQKLLDRINLSGCSKFNKLLEDLGNITSLKVIDLSATAIKELPSSIEFLIGLTSLDLTDCKNFVLLPSTICSLKSLYKIYLSGCSKFVNLLENLENLKDLHKLFLSETTIEVLPSSIGCLTTLKKLCLRDCKKLVCLPSTFCSLKMVQYLNITRC